MNFDPKTITARFAEWRNRQRIMRMARQIARVVGAHGVRPASHRPKIVSFNVSTRLTGLSQNAAFSMLTSWGLRLSGWQVVHFVCQGGLIPCVLGTSREDHHKAPPCAACIAQSKRIYTAADLRWFTFQADAGLAQALDGKNIEALCQFEHALNGTPMPLGSLVLPSLRWALRKHTLSDDEETRYLFRQYILSAYNTACQFDDFLQAEEPDLALIFNGSMYPEAAARWVARQRGLKVITHEVGFQRFSAFFTDGQATAYPIPIPDEFELSPAQNTRLDEYLEKRFQGKFTMAGIRFWPEMRGLDEAFLQKLSQFRSLVPVFTNVVYDTSQVHANRIFPHMFAWLDEILEIIRSHPETLFVIRAHPDEMRAGTAKLSRESVHDWVYRNNVHQLPNAVFIDSQEFISSYELIQRAHFVIVYNSSIGLEAALMGAAVLCGGKARYTQYPTVFLPETPQDYRRTADDFLRQEARIAIPPEFQRNARRFLYYQLFRASLPFENYLQEGHRMGFTHLAAFPWQNLLPENSPTMQVLVKNFTGAGGGTDAEDNAQPPNSNRAHTFFLEDSL